MCGGVDAYFNTRKQILLKTLYAYISHKRSLEDNYGISMFGTNSFNLVWEDVSSQVIGNKLNVNLSKLDLLLPLDSSYVKLKND